MKTAAVICEYNPFHAGHEKHLRRTRELGVDNIICIMSGPFTQRGEPAVADKWTRARQALLSGADVVVELPCLFALQSAEGFARGGVRIARALGADFLSFGAEGDPALLERAADAMDNETRDMSDALRESQKRGESNASARQAALEAFDPGLGALLNGPNNILAIEYLRAIRRLGGVEPMSVPRPYPDPALRDERPGLPSSSSVRRALSEAHSREECAHILRDCGCPVSFRPLFPDRKLFDVAMYQIRMTEDLERFAGINLPIASRLKKAADKAADLQQLLTMVATRSITVSRVKRCLMHLLLRTTKAEIESANHPESPLHARLLGFRADRSEFLGKMVKEARLRVVTRFQEFPFTALADVDQKADDLYTLLQDPPASARAGKTHRLEIVNSGPP